MDEPKNPTEDKDQITLKQRYRKMKHERLKHNDASNRKNKL